MGLILLLGICPLFAQEERLPSVLLDLPPDTLIVPTDSLQKVFQLPHKFIIPGTERLSIRRFRLSERLHYHIDYPLGTLRLTDPRLPRSDSLLITYRHFPFPLLSDFARREIRPVSAADSSDSTAQVQIATRAVQPGFLDDLESYQSNLQKSGSIVRGIEIGSNQDLTLNSGLNLQLSGQIAPDVELVAALTDESTPIQPEGNTQTLREVDKVFVKINSPYIGGTLGDFNLHYQKSEFGNLQRKLQGVTLESRPGNTTQQLTYGTSRGFFHTNRFLAQEGNQGPYLLTGRNGEREIIVLAGTERIYVDGVLQVRGENNDYIIDYGLAQITFTSRKLITSENRIEVDFEYTNSFQRYGRNFLGAGTAASNLKGRLSYDLRIFREWDDTKNLLEDDADLSDEETAALADAGDDPYRATVDGAVFVGADSTGRLRGDYQQAFDTLATNEIITYYRYVGSNMGLYRVQFSGVGIGNGDYRRISLGRYEYVGVKKGQYLPVRLVPLAGDKKLATLGMNLRLTRNWQLGGEVAVSQVDRNVFSPFDDGDNEGNAVLLSTDLQDSTLKVGGHRIGDIAFNARWRRQQRDFDPLDRALQTDYSYKWNLDAGNLSNEEESFESRLSYQPRRFLRVGGNLGTISKGADVRSDRRVGEMHFQNTPLPTFNYQIEQVNSSSSLTESEWLRHTVSSRRRLGRFTPAYTLRSEDRLVTGSTGRQTGFRFQDHGASLAIQELWGVRWQTGYQRRTDFLYDPHQPGQALEQAVTQTVTLGGELDPQRPLKGQFSFAYRDKNYGDFFEQLPDDSLIVYQPDAQFQDTSWQDRQSHLANVELQYRNKSGSLTARWDYKVASELQALREKIYLEVAENLGSFVYDSTLMEYVPDALGNYILIQLPTGEFESVTNLETAWQLQFRPAAAGRSAGSTDKILRNFSGITYVRVNEQSRNDNIWDLYLLRLNTFHSLGNSVASSYTINQDINYNERNPDWGLQFRTRYRDNLSNQYLDATNNETRLTLDRSMQLRRRLFNRKLNATLGYQNGFSKRWVGAIPARNLNVAKQDLSAGLNWRPGINWQLQMDLARGLERDRKSEDPLAVSYWEFKPRLSYAARGKARATADLTYLQVNADENPGNRAIPYEMGRGKKAGSSWLWNGRFEYFINTNVTINVNYTGRRDAGALRTIHLGKAEVRAFF